MTDGGPAGAGAGDACARAACRPRGPGRPRSEEADRAILRATVDLLAEVGPTGLSVEEVAARARVGKATIYRRWAGKDELVLDAVATLATDTPPPPVGAGLRDTLVALLEEQASAHQRLPAGALFPRLVAHARTRPAMFGCFYDRVIDPVREQFRVVLRAAADRGEVRADADVETVVTMLLSPLVFRMVMADGGRDPAPAMTPALLVDTVLDGIGTA